MYRLFRTFFFIIPMITNLVYADNQKGNLALSFKSGPFWSANDRAKNPRLVFGLGLEYYFKPRVGFDQIALGGEFSFYSEIHTSQNPDVPISRISEHNYQNCLFVQVVENNNKAIKMIFFIGPTLNMIREKTKYGGGLNDTKFGGKAGIGALIKLRPNLALKILPVLEINSNSTISTTVGLTFFFNPFTNKNVNENFHEP